MNKIILIFLVLLATVEISSAWSDPHMVSGINTTDTRLNDSNLNTVISAPCNVFNYQYVNYSNTIDQNNILNVTVFQYYQDGGSQSYFWLYNHTSSSYDLQSANVPTPVILGSALTSDYFPLSVKVLGISWSAGCTWIATASEVVVYGNVPPTIPTLLTPTNNSLYNTTSIINLAWSSTDNESDTLTYDLKINGSVYLTNISYNNTNVILPEGTHNWTVRAYDGYNYSDYANLSYFTVDLIPDIITDPDCTSHGATWAVCTWNDATAPSFDHVYLTNYTGSNSSWDSNVSAGIESKTFTGLSKGNYNFSAQTVSNMGSISGNITWLNFSVNDYNFTFSNKSISSTSIVANTGATTISVKINDSDGNITAANVIISYMAIPFTYAMTNGSDDFWFFAFGSANQGAYQITEFNAGDDSGDTNSTTWNQTFFVIAQSSGGSSGGGGVAPTPTVNKTALPPLPAGSNINLLNMGKDRTGREILQGMFIIGFAIFIWSIREGTSDSGIFVGSALMLLSSWGLGWL
ncbi:MAG: hypothetical protein FIB07_16980 [Candidatus Methanoperedens sp.]|nr:hypothetical protein [Candidatus Methanoperedens sp.]